MTAPLKRGDRRLVTVLYRGRRTFVELVAIDEVHELEVKAARTWLLMVAAAAKDDVALEANSAFRSFLSQQKLWLAYRRYAAYIEKLELWQKGGKVGLEPARVDVAALANAPGTSTHEVGNAVDVKGAKMKDGKIDKWLTANATRFGWKRTVPSERWHYNFVG